MHKHFFSRMFQHPPRLTVWLLVTCSLIHVPPLRSLSAAEQAPGALIHVTMRSTVGVVLDDIPVDLRDQVAASYLQMPSTFWQERANRQIEHTLYRLIYRNFFYSKPKGLLPLPPKDLWSVTLDAAGAQHKTFQGHEAVLIRYELTTTILTDVDSPATAEPRLSRVGGVWNEPFKLPLDPEFLLQRTGFACVDEDALPPHTADSENVRFLESLATVIVTDEPTPVTITCPGARDALEPGSQVSLYVAPVSYTDPVKSVNCTMP